MIGIGVIGFGYWGPLLARQFDLPGRSRVAVVCDPDPARLALAAAQHPQAETTHDAGELLRAPGVDAVVVATPARSHFELAMKAFDAGRHVLVCKPMTETSLQAQRLIDAAGRRGLVLLVDHTFVYAPAVQAMAAVVREGRLGQVHYWDAVRVNLGLFRPDVNVLWDLAIHDLAVLDHVLGARPEAVSATGAGHVEGWPENLAYLTLFLPGGAIAHVNVNWLAPIKLRRTIVGLSGGMIVHDEMQPDAKLRIHDKGVSLQAPGLGYRNGEAVALATEGPEPLAREAEHFLDCIEQGAAPITGAPMALRLIGLLEHAERSLRARGAPIAVT